MFEELLGVGIITVIVIFPIVFAVAVAYQVRKDKHKDIERAIKLLENRPLEEFIEWLLKAGVLDRLTDPQSLQRGCYDIKTLTPLTGKNKGCKKINPYYLGKVLGSLVHNNIVDIELLGRMLAAKFPHFFTKKKREQRALKTLWKGVGSKHSESEARLKEAYSEAVNQRLKICRDQRINTEIENGLKAAQGK